jgi:hypothetical protein
MSEMRWEPLQPIVMMASSVRDQSTRTTYRPFSCRYTGAIGYRIQVDGRAHEPKVYLIPTDSKGVHQVRCHLSDTDPDPEHDPLLGTIEIPDNWT